LINKTK